MTQFCLPRDALLETRNSLTTIAQPLAAQLIATQSAFDEAIKHLQDQPAIALDTEFVRRRTFFAELGLIQIASTEAVFLFDPLAKVKDQALGDLLQSASVLKVLHSVGEDLEVLRDRFGAPPGQVFDTQIAATLAGLGASLSLAKLALAMLDFTLDKAETTSDWLVRPLSAAQMEYAADDVRVLLPMHAQLRAKLSEQGRLAWLEQDCAKLVAQSSKNEMEAQPHHRIKTCFQMTESAQRKLWHILRWRDEKARARNLPKSWVLDTQVACDLVQVLWRDENHLQREVDRLAPKSSKRAPELWKFLSNDMPTSEFVPAPKPLEGEALARFRTLKSTAEAHALKLALKPETIASRKLLEAMASETLSADEQDSWRVQLLRTAA
jgi:ribonuclease D